MTMNRQRIILTTIMVSAALAITLYWWQRGRPVAMPHAPSTRINCVSYAPYHRPGQTPFAEGTVISPAQIGHDLSQLAKRFDCVRTYSVGQGLNAVPSIAHRLGMQVLLGIWLGRDRRANAREIALGIQTARSNRDTIRAIIVGNEVLLRGELPAAELAAYIAQVKTSTDLPVTYADVWEYWLKYPQLANAVSFITIHILPYWEDHPVAIGNAIAHVQDVYARLLAAFPGKSILIGETGWPSAGRQRGGALPSRVNEARFVRGFLDYAANAGVRYNLVEAYDQPWKRWLEGTAGGYWGLYAADGQQKFPWHGSVSEDPNWYFGLLAGIGFSLILYLSTLVRRSKSGTWYTTALLLLGYSGGALLAAECGHLLTASRDGFEWLMGSSWALLELITSWWLAHTFARYLQTPGESYSERIYRFRLLDRIGLRQTINPQELLWFLWLFAAAVVCLLLVFDPRYRGFPIALFLPAAAGFATLSLLYPGAIRKISLENRILAAWLGFAALLILSIEGTANTQALAWAALCVLLSGSVWLPYLRTRQHQHADHQPDRTGFETIPDQTGHTDDRTQPRDPA
jgi:exo-beta-1,3-glucanase (GH17 family)